MGARARLFAADPRDWLRLVGGLLFGVSGVILALRKAGVLPEADTFLVFATL